MPKSYVENSVVEKLYTPLLNIFFTIVIFYTSELGKFLAIYGAPITTSIIWLPTGFAVAGFLLFGTRIWPGIFLGNFLYSFLHLYLHSKSIMPSLLTGSFIAALSLFETYLASYVMKRYSSPGYFATVKDVAIFIIPATLLVSILSATLGMAALYFYDPTLFKLPVLLSTWTAFWVEDTLGLYVLVPLLVVWSTQRLQINFKDHLLEFTALVAGFSLISILTFIWGDPFAHLFILLSLWSAYSFRMHGATLANFLIAMIIVIPTGLNYGAFALHTTNPYLTLTTFIDVSVIASLVLAALMNEREAALLAVKNKNIDLTDAFETHMEGFKDIHSDIVAKEKLTSSLSLLTLGLARQLHLPLKRINNLIKASIVSLGRIQESVRDHSSKVGPELSTSLFGHLKILENYLHDILKFEKQAGKMSQMIQEQASLSTKDKQQTREVNLNKLLTLCLNQAAKHFANKHPEFTFVGKTEFDEDSEMPIAFPQDLAHAFIYFINHSLESMHRKKRQLNNSYQPTLLIKTQNLANTMEVIIQDNGLGATEDQVKSYFHSFVKDKDLDSQAYDLSLAHDIIIYIHDGDLKVSSEKGQFFKIVVTLPKRSTIQLGRSSYYEKITSADAGRGKSPRP